MTGEPQPAPRLRFSVSMRLTHDREYQRVYSARTSVTRGPLRVSGVPNGRKNSRLGLSVPKRVGTSVVRNAIKRLLRDAFRLSRSELPQGLDLVIGVHPHQVMTLDAYQERLIDAAAELARTWEKRGQRRGGGGEP